MRFIKIFSCSRYVLADRIQAISSAGKGSGSAPRTAIFSQHITLSGPVSPLPKAFL